MKTRILKLIPIAASEIFSGFPSLSLDFSELASLFQEASKNMVFDFVRIPTNLKPTSPYTENSDLTLQALKIFVS
jgi:hypothetical protein